MGADATLTAEPDFGRVSRRRGAAFRYLTMGASWFGIVVLVALLVRVAVDAFGLGTASPSWYLVYAITVVLPLIAVAAYGRRNRDAGRVALQAIAVPVAGTALAAGLAVFFVVLNPQIWFVGYTTAALPAVLTYLIATRRGDGRAPFLAAGVGLIGVVAGIAVWRAVATFPVTWIIYWWTLGVPVAAGVGVAVARRRGVRSGAAAALGILAGAAAVAVGLPALGRVSPADGVLLFLTPVVPTALLFSDVLVGRPAGRAGLLAPVVIVGGSLVGNAVVRAVGAEGPTPWLDWQFLTSAASVTPELAGLFPAIVGSVVVIAVVAVLSFVLGVGAAIYLEEYAPSTGPLGTATRVIRINIANLAGVPSVVYGLLGLGLFVNLLGMGIGTVLVAALTLSLLILPIVIISAQEAIRSVPDDLRQASYGLGATRWQTLRNVVLPRAVPGILTGTILSMSRAIGETAPLLMIGAATTVFRPPTGLGSQVSAMPLQVFYWSFAAKSAFRDFVAPAGVVTLLIVLLAMNSTAIYLRNRYQREA